MDCISSLGMMPLDLTGVWMATGVSGKGLGAPAGLSLVFHAEPITPAGDLPAYLDLGTYAANDGVPFTASSILYGAVHAALRRRFGVPAPGAPPAIFAERLALDDWVRGRLAELRLPVLAPPERRLVGVLTVCVPENRPTAPMGETLAANGFLVHYRNVYLLRRNVIQLCLMGDYTREKLEPLFALLAE
jgi:aspartate aminotransferase-like enzyme